MLFFLGLSDGVAQVDALTVDEGHDESALEAGRQLAAQAVGLGIAGRGAGGVLIHASVAVATGLGHVFEPGVALAQAAVAHEELHLEDGAARLGLCRGLFVACPGLFVAGFGFTEACTEDISMTLRQTIQAAPEKKD